ncbi:MAG: YceD family protein, partial [Akkermansia sp.]
MQSSLIIDLEDFPEEGRRLCGELDGALLDVDGEALQCTGAIAYELTAQLFDTELVLRGRLSAPFRLRCDRCLGFFDYTVEADGLALSYDVKGKLSVDVTEDVREELILALPAYPKCELAGRECKINDILGDFRLDKDPRAGVDSATPSGNSVWDA